MKPQEKREKLSGMTQFVQRIPSQKTTAEEADEMHLSIAKFGPETTYEELAGRQRQAPPNTSKHHEAPPSTADASLPCVGILLIISGLCKCEDFAP